MLVCNCLDGRRVGLSRSLIYRFTRGNPAGTRGVVTPAIQIDRCRTVDLNERFLRNLHLAVCGGRRPTEMAVVQNPRSRLRDARADCDLDGLSPFPVPYRALSVERLQLADERLAECDSRRLARTLFSRRDCGDFA